MEGGGDRWGRGGVDREGSRWAGMGKSARLVGARGRVAAGDCAVADGVCLDPSSFCVPFFLFLLFYWEGSANSCPCSVVRSNTCALSPFTPLDVASYPSGVSTQTRRQSSRMPPHRQGPRGLASPPCLCCGVFSRGSSAAGETHPAAAKLLSPRAAASSHMRAPREGL